MAWGKKTGTLDDVLEPIARIAATSDRSVQDRYLPALDAALSSLPSKERRKAGPVVFQALWAAEAKYVHSLTGEEVDLITAKLGVAISEVLYGYDPVKALGSGGDASSVVHNLRAIGNGYLKACQGR